MEAQYVKELLVTQSLQSGLHDHPEEIRAANSVTRSSINGVVLQVGCFIVFCLIVKHFVRYYINKAYSSSSPSIVPPPFFSQEMLNSTIILV